MKEQEVVPGSRYPLHSSVVATLIVVMVSFTPSFAQKAESAKTVKKKVSTKTLTVDSAGKKNVVTKTKTTTVATTTDDAEDVDINISVSGGDKSKRSVTRVRVVAGDESGSGATKKKTIKTIDIQGDPAEANGPGVAHLDAELAKAKRELEKVDWDQIKTEIVDAFKELDKELNLDALAKEINVEIRRELENSKKALKEASEEVNKHIKGKANAEANDKIRQKSVIVEKRGTTPPNEDIEVVNGPDMHEMLDKMDKAGLIDKKGKFRIEKADGELFINGVKQPASVLQQYSKYLSANEVKIKGSKGDLSIYIND